MKVTDHFKNRLFERFGYEIEELVPQIINPIQVSEKSDNLKIYPQFKNMFKKYPKTIVIILERLNMCLITSDKSLITCYSL